jgi:CRISPR-associated protein Cas2
MTVIIGHDVPDAIRGLLKRWFIEPRPNIFVGTINRRTRDKTLEYIRRNAPGIAMLIISSDPNCQGFKIQSHGDVRRKEAVKSGLWLVAEEWVESENCPF